MYIAISFFGLSASRNRSWATTRVDITSSTVPVMKMMRSFSESTDTLLAMLLPRLGRRGKGTRGAEVLTFSGRCEPGRRACNRIAEFCRSPPLQHRNVLRLHFGQPIGIGGKTGQIGLNRSANAALTQ